MSKDAGVRPYTYYFPYEECPHAMNAIDFHLKILWVEVEKEKQEKREQERKQDKDTSSPVQFSDSNNNPTQAELQEYFKNQEERQKEEQEIINNTKSELIINDG